MNYGNIKYIEETTKKVGYSNQDGYLITTDNGTNIWVGIDNGQSCCENWGYVTSHDSFDEFYGASLYTINQVDIALNVKTLVDVYDGDCMFVNLETSAGTLQFKRTLKDEIDGLYGEKED